MTFPKVFFLLLILALGLAIYWGLSSSAGNAPSSNPTMSNGNVTPAKSSLAPSPSMAPAPSQAQLLPRRSVLPPEEQELSQRTGELITSFFDKAVSDDPAEVDAVYAALNDPNPEIQEGALDAIVQMIGSAAVPRLTVETVKITHPRQKVAIAEAIEFLKLPTLSSQNLRPRSHSSSGSEPKRQRKRLPLTETAPQD